MNIEVKKQVPLTSEPMAYPVHPNPTYAPAQASAQAFPVPAGVQRPTKLKRGKRFRPGSTLAQGSGKWTEEEHSRFLQALNIYGNCWKKVEDFVGTRSCAQIRSHCQKYFRRLRNKTMQDLRRANQLRGKVFIVTKEYFNYSGCGHQTPEEELVQEPAHAHLLEPGSTKTEEHKDSFPAPRNGPEEEPRLIELFEEPRAELEEGIFNAGVGYCQENGFSGPANEVAFGDDYEDRGYPFLARVQYEA